METRQRGRGRSKPNEPQPIVGPYNGASTNSRDHRGQRFDAKPLFPRPLSIPLILGFVVLVFAFVKIVDNRLPEIISEAELAQYPNR